MIYQMFDPSSTKKKLISTSVHSSILYLSVYIYKFLKVPVPCRRFIDMESIRVVFISSLFWFAASIVVIYIYLKNVVYGVWNRKNVPHDHPSIPFGNVPLSFFMGETTHGELVKKSYHKYKNFRFHGIYILCEPVLVINDPELIQLVLVKNFTQFYNRGVLSDAEKDPLSAHLARLEDEKWKRLRSKLSPTFTSGKLKLMFPLIKEICDQLINTCDNALESSDIIELKTIITRFTIDCISSIAYGFNCDSLHNTDTPFLKYGKMSNYVGRVFILFSFFIPQLIKFVPVPEKRRELEKFFTQIFIDMVEHRRKEKVSRNDFLNMLIELIDYGKILEDETSEKKCHLSKLTEADKLTIMEAVSQAFIFFSAGQETTSSAISCCLYELALNPDIQQELFNEINKVHNNPGDLTYEKLFGMQYLDMVFQETLRKYPGSSILNRIAVEDFKIPNSDFIIEKGMRIVIPITGLHMDPDIYSEPEKFNPIRFTPENKAKRHNFSYVPFGEGPRQCIGKRLGSLKPKIALFYMLLNYEFSVCEKTSIPIKYQPDYFVQVPYDIYLKVRRRKRTNEI
ncbi:cytochrome P450 6a2-like [Phymastichus coffea]|uniref:cytochrome P450 6a2-like n=1 Tax=Phymastichus coffea TaxID=108790 RepID=UPI00273ACE12|nr:cytochrome P450 6a2-like [Phymastichus coffea]